MATAVDREPVGGAADAPAGKLAAQTARRIETDVIRRGWPVGESLGSEGELRERLGVSRAVLREAVRLVEHHQVARMRRGPGGGLVVRAPDPGAATRAVVIYLDHVGTSVTDLLQARLLLEPVAAGLAAERITEEGVGTLRAALDAEPGRQDEPWVHVQDPLHPVLGGLSGNPVLYLFIDVLTRLTDYYAHTSRRISKAETRAAKELSHREHRAVVDAVIAADGARAQAGLTAHLESVAAWIEEHRVRRRNPPSRNVIGPEPAEGSRAKLAEVVAARIHDDIAAHGRRVGTVLGSETELLARYGISRAVLREAVRLLEDHSVARTRRGPGGGLVVTEPEPQASIDTMALFLEYRGATAEDLRIVRNALELGVVARVTTRHTAGDTEVCERLGEAVRRSVQGPPGDSRDAGLFHTELADLAANPVLSLFLAIIAELSRRHAPGHDRPLPGEPAADEVRESHQRILDAIGQGDSALARHRMRRHLDTPTRWWH
ncbi:FadR/GntR family transcriptional regulator [Streptomyces fuscichromogenes]|uniref:GntR family transcriptional regulator n=1 Tax=Streptomyces fuscichromogenes TaxID=1324013 RepID=A0A917XPU1_9ACTN|nr:FCD domain-containing protein [Streptomyces fuscichromogenes]GGN43914.1 GntR family transcriptional regulator [Streptomyces fuscichromogenes]